MQTPHAISHRYAIDFFREDGDHLGCVPVEPDWTTAREFVCFDAVRRGRLAPSTAQPAARIDPLWSDASGPPVCRAVRVALDAHEVDLSLDFFQGLAEDHATTWVEQGALERGARFRFELLAHPREPRERAGTPGGLVLTPESEPLPVHAVDLGARLATGRVHGTLDSLDAPVLIPESVLEETLELSRAAGELETGGILVGQLTRDASGGELAIEVTAQIPARHAQAKETSFAFTPETWSAAQAALTLRDEGEIWTGWWHAHPMFCARCPDERRRHCVYAQPVFSRDDLHLHRTCFAAGWNVALLISDLPERRHTPALFGWREGRITPRGFHICK